jgi:two-component sensor histidine kinase
MKLFTPDTSKIRKFEDKGKFIMAWRFTIVFILLFSSMTPLSFGNSTVVIIYSILATLSVFMLIFLKLSKNYYLIFSVYSIAGTVLSQYSLNMIPEVTHYTEFLWMFVIVVFAFISINKLAGWTFMIINVLGLSWFTLFNLNTHIGIVEVQSLTTRIINIVEIISVFLVLGYLVNQYVFFQHYSQLQLKKLNFNLEQRNEEVLNRNKENITLIKEVHHRVKNNLQIIISLLRMQRSEIKSEENQEQFTIAINRILTMSLIHQKLYQEKEPSRINIADYINDLSQELLSVANRKVSLEIDSDDEYAGLKTIVPFGLLVNELISNSLKHAYSESESAVIRIQIKPKNEREIYFFYEDNGQWVEPKEEEIGSFGLELIDVLTEQLDGTYKREGSHYSFEIVTTED